MPTIEELENSFLHLGVTTEISPACLMPSLRGRYPSHHLGYTVTLPGKIPYVSSAAFASHADLARDLYRLADAIFEIRIEEIRKQAKAKKNEKRERIYQPNMAGAVKIERYFESRGLIVKILPAETWQNIANDAKSCGWDPVWTWGIKLQTGGGWLVDGAFANLRHVACHLSNTLKRYREDQGGEE